MFGCVMNGLALPEATKQAPHGFVHIFSSIEYAQQPYMTSHHVCIHVWQEGKCPTVYVGPVQLKQL